MKQGIGASMMLAGTVLGGLNYLLTAFAFFSQGDALLGLIQLIVPPSELVLPWIVSPMLGVVSLVSLGLILIGGSLADE